MNVSYYLLKSILQKHESDYFFERSSRFDCFSSMSIAEDPNSSPVVEPKRRFRFDAKKRIKLERDFARVYEGRARAYNERMTVCCRARIENEQSRLGLSTSKKVGKAHIRARWKRLIREAFRLQYYDLPQGYDFIVIPKKQDKVPCYSTIADDLVYLARRAAKKADKNVEKAINESAQDSNNERGL